MPNKKKTITGTTSWVRADFYTYQKKVSRWTILLWLIWGEMRLHWLVPASKKDKRYHLKGELGA